MQRPISPKTSPKTLLCGDILLLTVNRPPSAKTTTQEIEMEIVDLLQLIFLPGLLAPVAILLFSLRSVRRLNDKRN